MRDTYSDDFESVAADGAAGFLPESARRIAGAVVFAGLIAVMGVWAWRLGTRDATEVPIIRAMAGPTRMAPEDPGGLQAEHQGLEVNGVLSGVPVPAPRAETAAVAPAPEVLTAEDAPQGELVVNTPAILAARVLQEAGELPMPAEVPEDEIAPAIAAETVIVDDALEVAEEEAVAAAALPPMAGPRPMNRPSNLVVARVTPASAPAAPSAPARPAAASSRSAEPGPAAAAREVAAAPARGQRMVQLGAYDSEEMTRRAWSRLVSANPDLLSSKSLYVERTTSNARVFYRLRVAGFDSSDQTRVMCESLRARGIDCIPVTLQ